MLQKDKQTKRIELLCSYKKFVAKETEDSVDHEKFNPHNLGACCLLALSP